MRRIWVAAGLLAGLLVVVGLAVQSRSDQGKVGKADERPPEKAAAPADGDRSADEAAIRANVRAFVRAYNKHDAKAVAALFTPDAVIMDKEQDMSQGRAAIERTFAAIFKASPQKHLEVTVEAIRFLGPDLALEVGSTAETDFPGDVPDNDRYTVLHVKRDGRWLAAAARDEEGPEPTTHERLLALAWLVGEWVDDGGSVVVASKCRWSKDGNFLLQEFDLKAEGRAEMHVTQRIGWDPLAKHIRSWIFDSEGGYGESVWTQTQNVWVIKATWVRQDGKTASSTNVLAPNGKDHYVWRSTDRVVGDEVQPPFEARVARKPPEAKP